VKADAPDRSSLHQCCASAVVIFVVMVPHFWIDTFTWAPVSAVNLSLIALAAASDRSPSMY
jgi:hypothetical protein